MNHSRARLIDSLLRLSTIITHARSAVSERRDEERGRKKRFTSCIRHGCDLIGLITGGRAEALTVCTAIQTITAWGYWEGVPSDLGMCKQHWHLIMNCFDWSLNHAWFRDQAANINHTESRRIWVAPYVPCKDTMVLVEYSSLSKAGWLPNYSGKQKDLCIFLQGLLLLWTETYIWYSTSKGCAIFEQNLTYEYTVWACLHIMGFGPTA
jgi:hypothetical protein